MVHFINDVRKEYKTPNMPFVIGVFGTPGPRKRLMKMQSLSLSAKRQSILSSKAMYSPLRATRTTPTTLTQFLKKGWPEHYHEWDTAGSDRPYHYLGSGVASFVRLGDSFANAISELMAKN